MERPGDPAIEPVLLKAVAESLDVVPVEGEAVLGGGWVGGEGEREERDEERCAQQAVCVGSPARPLALADGQLTVMSMLLGVAILTHHFGLSGPTTPVVHERRQRKTGTRPFGLLIDVATPSPSERRTN